MTKNLSFSAGLLVMALLLVSIPALSQAATFAYVSQTGFVKTVNADSASAALFGVSAIDEHSGVMLLNTVQDFLMIGQRVLGV